MPGYIQQQMLLYTDRADDIATVARILDLLREKDPDGAARQLVIYLDKLQDSQKPRLAPYDPRIEQEHLR
jgi:hypothetical protein